MTTANFTWVSPRNSKIIIHGKVTLKDDGKVSVSMSGYDKYNSSASERYQAKALALQIVKDDFKHDAASNVVVTKHDTGLIAALTEKTQDLHDKFIDMTKKAARRIFDNCEKANKRTLTEWYDVFGVKWENKDLNGTGRITSEPLRDEYNGKKLYKMRDAIQKTRIMVLDGYAKYEAKEIKYAENHYSDSIIKLARRLNDKGITDGSEFVITTGWVGVNLEITIKHGEQTTKAWTIIAEGEIQRAHYRYLVK